MFSSAIRTLSQFSSFHLPLSPLGSFCLAHSGQGILGEGPASAGVALGGEHARPGVSLLGTEEAQAPVRESLSGLVEQRQLRAWRVCLCMPGGPRPGSQARMKCRPTLSSDHRPGEGPGGRLLGLLSGRWPCFLLPSPHCSGFL